MTYCGQLYMPKWLPQYETNGPLNVPLPKEHEVGFFSESVKNDTQYEESFPNE